MSNERSLTLRSNFLIHWTGWDIEARYGEHPDARRREYLQRLRCTLISGLWMTGDHAEDREKVYGDEDSYIEYEVPRTCFSEIKLSAVRQHTRRYGYLGFGFERMFVVEHSGTPVHYVSGTTDDQIVRNLNNLLNFEREVRAYFSKVKPPPNIRTQLDLICDEWSEETDIEVSLLNILVNIGFVKKMSDCVCPHDFQYLDEAEWRIVYTKRRFEEDKLRATDREYPRFKIPFGPADLKVLILPDAEVRRMAFEDEAIRRWFRHHPPDLPAIVTVDECSQF